MSTSTIPAVIDALLAALRARPALQAPDVAVVDGYPSRNLSQTRLITIGGQAEPTVTGDQTVTSLGNRRREEDYAVRVYCSADAGGTDQKGARDRAFGLLAELEETLRDDATLGGIVRYAEVAGSLTLLQTDESTAASGRWAEVSVDVRVRNRI
jgi:hypothetical protein